VDDVAAFTPASVQAWARAELKRGVSARTVASRLGHLSSLGDYLARQQIIPANPAREVERPKFKKRPSNFLHPAEVKALLAVPTPENERTALAIFLDSMLRVSELCQANVHDLAGDMLRVTVKGGQTRDVPLSPDVADQVRGYLASRGELSPLSPLVANSRGQRWSRQGLSARVGKIARQAGVTRFRVGAHSLRHTAASLALASGVDVLSVSKLLGHADLKTTTSYLHLLPNALVSARAQQRAGLKRYLA
jgi:site-specific recombinase XerD